MISLSVLLLRKGVGSLFPRATVRPKKSLSTITDLICAALPPKFLRNLQMGLKTKVGLSICTNGAGRHVRYIVQGKCARPKSTFELSSEVPRRWPPEIALKSTSTPQKYTRPPKKRPEEYFHGTL